MVCPIPQGDHNNHAQLMQHEMYSTIHLQPVKTHLNTMHSCVLDGAQACPPEKQDFYVALDQFWMNLL